MNIIKLALAGLFRIMQKSYEAYRIDSLKSNKGIVLQGNTRIFEAASLEPSKEKSIIIGENCGIRGRIVTFPAGGKVTIGNDCYVGHNTQIWSEEEICIGNRVLIAHNCNVFDSSTHPVDREERHDQFTKIMITGFPINEYSSLKKGRIIIEDDAWIGANCTILRGVRIGAGTIVSVGSVVNKNVPPNVIVAGNPAKIVKTLEQI